MVAIIYLNKDMFELDILFSAALSGTINGMLFILGFIYNEKHLNVCTFNCNLYAKEAGYLIPIADILINSL